MSEVFHIYTKQAVLEGSAMIIVGAIVLAIVSPAIAKGWSLIGNEYEDDLIYFGIVVLFIVGICAVWAIVVGSLMFVNPEYYSMQTLLGR